MDEHVQDVRLAGALLERPRHVCGFFHTPEEEFRVLLPFFQEGLDRADKVFYIVDPERRDQLVGRLQQAGLDTRTTQASGQLEVRPWEKAHLRGGRFNQEAMLSLLDGVLANNKTQGYPLTRVWSNQEWALGDSPGVEDIVEYESRFNYIAAKHDDPVVCVFDLSRFGADVVVDILRTHPMVIIGGTLQENPFYVPPEEFLRELRQRSVPAANQ